MGRICPIFIFMCFSVILPIFFLSHLSFVSLLVVPKVYYSVLFLRFLAISIAINLNFSVWSSYYNIHS